MNLIEILTIVFASLFVVVLLSRYIYKKVKHLPTGECSSCSSKKSNLLKDYHKMYKKEYKCEKK